MTSENFEYLKKVINVVCFFVAIFIGYYVWDNYLTFLPHITFVQFYLLRLVVRVLSITFFDNKT